VTSGNVKVLIDPECFVPAEFTGVNLTSCRQVERVYKQKTRNEKY